MTLPSGRPPIYSPRDMLKYNRYRNLTSEEALVYSYIESAGREGIWSKLLRMRTNLHMTTMNRAIKALEGRNYIKSIKTIKFPTRKTYILAKLQPSEDVTGGPFYTDGVLDAEFIHQMSWWAERYIVGRSWWHPPADHGSTSKRKTGGGGKMTQQQAEEARAEGLQQKKHAPVPVGRERSKRMLPMPPDYRGYPTIAEITAAINQSELSGVTMRTAEMQQLIDVLCWDDRLERVSVDMDVGGDVDMDMDVDVVVAGTGGKRVVQAYRATRSVAAEVNSNGNGNGLTEAPCGRCPVFDVCEPDGPVNARTCEYFQEWLEF